ncbi:hypothetical protein EG327_006258 [Venturia inaequalis]|uniref:7alpha-cephem-methoxylase P8 chain n=1 Tax=Venturia inaequalis TaxID=5025 RepID=A0A8H3V2N2_VENIN|nr:hypothetical protein EG327_006258 [Venturia inaequalis]
MSTATAFQPTPAHQLHNPQDQSTAPASRDLQIPRGTVTASLSFYTPPEDGSKPYNYAGPWADNPPHGIPRNFSNEDHDVTISDIRGQESTFNLDANAFAALKNVPSAMKDKDWESDEMIEKVYYAEVEKLLLDSLPGSSRICLFDHTIRRPGTNRQPVSRVHIDQTAKSTQARVKHHLGDEAEDLLKGRYRIVNVWRPLNGPVYASPLAVADSASVQDDDLVGVEHRYPDRTGETAGVKYNKSQKWYYWSGMENNERLFLKCFDSDENVGPHGRVPHSAFVDPRTPEGAPGRESIEVRALVFG